MIDLSIRLVIAPEQTSIDSFMLVPMLMLMIEVKVILVVIKANVRERTVWKTYIIVFYDQELY